MGEAMVVGVDEAGRGALAGPVVAAAVCLGEELDPELFMDSKQLTAARREDLYAVLLASSSKIGVGVLSHRLVDKYNVLQASMMAMQRAVFQLDLGLDLDFGNVSILVDGNKVPSGMPYACEAVVKGDALVPAISAASIVAKVLRDKIMVALEKKFSGYGFSEHKGYATRVHYEALFQLGPCAVHRQSFNLHKQERLF